MHSFLFFLAIYVVYIFFTTDYLLKIIHLIVKIYKESNMITINGNETDSRMFSNNNCIFKDNLHSYLHVDLFVNIFYNLFTGKYP